jgi:hypothetical protein
LESDPTDSEVVDKIRGWLRGLNIQTLNVAGPSESTAPGIEERAYFLLTEVFKGVEN